MLIALTWPVSVWLGTSLHAWRLHGNTTYPESAVVQNALLAAHDGHLYRPLTQAPFTPTLYGPLYYGVLAAIARVGSLDHQGLLEAGRTLSFAAFLGIALLLYALARRAGLAPLYALLATAFFAALQDTSPLNMSVRPDMLALSLALSGLYLFTKSEEGHSQDTPSPSTLAFAGLCFGAAVMVKQSFIAAPTAALIMLLTRKHLRAAVTLTATVVAVAFTCVMVPLLHGDSFFANLGALSHTVTDLHGEIEFLLYELFYPGIHAPLLLCAVPGVVWAFRQPALRTMVIYFAITWPLAVLIGMHAGASVNVLLEPWTLCSLFAAFGARWLWEQGGVLACAMLAATILICAAHPSTGLNTVNAQAINEMPSLARYERLVAGRKVLADDPYLAAHSAEPIMLDIYESSILEQSGYWNPQPLLQQINAQKFEVVMITVQNRYIRVYRGVPFLSASIYGAITSHYSVKCHLVKAPGYAEFAVLTPNDKPMSTELVMQLQQAGCK